MGRKVVKERVGDNVNEYNHYRGMHENQGERFDQEWSNAAQDFGFGSRPALGYAQGGRLENHYAESRGLGMPEGYADRYPRQELQAQVPGARGGGFVPRTVEPEPPRHQPMALPQREGQGAVRGVQTRAQLGNNNY